MTLSSGDMVEPGLGIEEYAWFILILGYLPQNMQEGVTLKFWFKHRYPLFVE
jgi:hypothetical protein